nr:ElyC/SanA/YdcF family protein [Thioalkalivibrio sp. XN8]
MLPTWRSWLVIIGVLALGVLAAARHVHGFLAVERPAEDATILVVEGWLSQGALDRAVALYRDGAYRLVVTTGGPIESWSDSDDFPSYADRASDYLVRSGVPADQIHSVPAPASAQNRTFLSAVMLRYWLDEQELAPAALDILSGGVHARRSHRLFRLALGPRVRVGILAAEADGYDPTAWWRSSAGAKAVMGELISLGWTVCCFRAPEPGSHQEHWGETR